MLKVLRRTRRHALTSRLIDEQREKWGDRSAAGLLASTDSATVERLLPELAYCLTVGEWRRLAATHPAVVLDYAAQTMPAGPDRREWWQGVGHGVTNGLDHDAARVLALIKEALPADELPWAMIEVIGRLTDLDPSGMLDLLLTPSRAGPIHRALTPSFRRRLHRFTDDELASLGRLLWPHLTDLLSDLAPSRRTAVFRAVTESIDLTQQQLPDALLEVLPRAERQDQARRMLQLAGVREDARRTWEIAAYLPFEEAFALLEPEIRRPEADDRGAVYRAVISSAGHSREPARIRQALAWATRVRNDRDQVRNAVLTAATDLPPSLLTDDHVEPLQILLTDALEARDTSWDSRAALNRLAEVAVRQGALRNQSGLLRWGIDSHARLTENRGLVNLYRLIDGLPRGREVAVYEALRPYVGAGAGRREFELAFSIAGAFGRRGWTIEHLHGVLERAVWSNQEYTVGQAARFWLEPTVTRADRVGRIIARDVGMARWDPVWHAVTELRTDLLDPVFAKPARTRRFDRNQPSWHVPAAALRRWLPRQHLRYAELLAAAAGDTRVPDWARASAVSTLGSIPGIGRAAVEPFLGREEVLLQEAALGALAWTDRPDLALPVLLSHAGDDRARVAVYAATRAARFVRPSLLASAFQPVLVGDGVKVTSRKEAARLLGELRAPGAGVVLAEAWPGAHRDVRAAITSAASQYLLHEPASWALLQQAVHDSPATAAVLAQRAPYDVATKYRSRYADLLIAVANRTEPEVVRVALLSLHRWAPWNPAAAPVCAAFITDLGLRNRTWSDATTSLVAIVAAAPDRGLDELVAVVRLLVRLESDPNVPNATADRDHPARQRLTVLVDRLVAAFRSRSTEARQALRPVAAELTDFLHLRLRLLISALNWSALGADLDTLAELVAARPLAAITAADLLATRLTESSGNWTAEELAEPTRHLLAAPEQASHLIPDSEPADHLLAGSEPADRVIDGAELARGLFAYALIAAAGPRSGWSATWRSYLTDLRTHAEPDVRQRALDLPTTTEV